ncbi:MAG TPA: DUF2911 domain-containing protein [Pedobacter sp.]|nr:DUF2911 domain-containing protein [Pedobacter sp.]
MKNFVFIALLSALSISTYAQDVKFPPMDSSPADIVYYPLNVVKAKDNSIPLIKVVYSRPSKKGREIFGVLEQFGKVWRVGANENTEIRFYKTAVIGGKKIKAGTYSLFAIPNKDKWTIIINKQIDKWGAFSYDQTKDLVRTEVNVKSLDKPLETLSVTFTTQATGANLVIGWDLSSVEVPVTIKQ